MKKITLVLTLIISTNLAFANPVDTLTAKRVAVNFWKQNNTGPSVKGKTLRFQRETPDFRLLPMDTLFSGFYIFNAVNGNGFVIVSANDNAIPILGYSMDNSFQIENMPRNLKDWLNGYEQQIQNTYLFRCSDETRKEWGRLLAGEQLPIKSITNVTPLLSTHWDQIWPYNLSCPYDYDADDNTYTGCVATAMAQVLKYWEYPQIGVGSHTYTDPIYGTQSVNFETGIAWNEMLNDYSTSSSYTLMQASAISSLMYMCGVSVDMNYGTDASGIPFFIDNIGLGLPCPETALKTYFNYSDNLTGISKSDYTYEQWISILKNELDSNRVILYTGHDANNTAGHAFVCDGYSNNNLFHFNWGWSGQDDGYFSISALAPGSGGTGSGYGNYSYGQQAIIHISPANQTIHPNYDLTMHGTLATSDTSYLFGPNHPIAISCAVANTGNANFNGYLVAIVSDIDGNVVAEIPSNYTTITPNHYVNKSFTVQGGLPIGPGVYYVFITSTTNLNDPATSRIVKDNINNINFASFTVHYSADIETYSDFYLSEEPIYSGHSLTVNVSPANATTYPYYGAVSVALFSLTGSYIQTIQDTIFSSPIPAMSYAPDGIDFTGVVSVPSGDYLLALRYKPQGSSYWIYAGSTYYQNPVRITILDAPMADIYETNNTVSTAYSLTPVFTDNMAEVNTNGANFHNTTDVDYYKIVLPSGYSYDFVPVLQDMYYNDDISYSVDAKFYFSVDNTASWQGPFDYDASVLTAILNQCGTTMSDGGTVYFKVTPTSQGDIGTYSLHTLVIRSINPDQYEPNNTSAAAYNLGTVNSNCQNYNINANFHVTTDNDYYKINLPVGYSYSINANILNSYNNSNYSADAKFATSTDVNNWSSNYGGSMSALTISNGGTLYFRVLPYTDHEIGTYQLQISVIRTGGMEPDIYEPNNTSATAYNLGTVNSNSHNYNVNANFHVTTDNDYYKINLPAGYSYTVNADLLDSYNDNNYTADAKFATSTDGNDWSSNHGSSMPELTLPDGGTVYFRVLPYTDYEIGTYQLRIIVARMDGIEPDMYEPNNTVNTSYLLATISEQSSSVVADETFHTSSDVDHYKIDFPADYTYYVDAVIFDCANDPSCSVDAKISVSDDGINWSSVYGNYIPTMTIENGGRLYYRIVPQQDGATGTYRLHISVSRETGIQGNEMAAITLYPNPVADCFHLIVPVDYPIQRIEIYSMTGILVQTIEHDRHSEINVSQLSQGTYILKVYTSEGLLMRKFVKS